MSRRRRKQPAGWAHWGAPAAFLAAVTIAVLLVHSALNGHSKNLPVPADTRAVTPTGTTKTRPHHPVGKKRVYATVQGGDTFGSIAARQGISIEQLQSLNPGVSSNSLQVGQKLRVK
jgi:LysM repeat protein